MALDETHSCFIKSLIQADDVIPDKRLSFGDLIGELTHVIKTLNDGPNLLKNMYFDLVNVGANISEWECQESNKPFYEIWNTIQFVICVPLVSGERHIRDLFGDGLFIAGPALNNSLGHIHRIRSTGIIFKILELSKIEKPTELEILPFEFQTNGRLFSRTTDCVKNDE